MGALLGDVPGWGRWGPAGVGRIGLSGMHVVPGTAVLALWARHSQGSRAHGASGYKSRAQHLPTWKSTGNHRASEQMCALGQAQPTPPVLCHFPCPRGSGCLSRPWAFSLQSPHRELRPHTCPHRLARKRLSFLPAPQRHRHSVPSCPCSHAVSTALFSASQLGAPQPSGRPTPKRNLHFPGHLRKPGGQ